MDLMPQETSLMLRGRHQACLWPGQKPFRQSCLRCCWSSIFETLYHDNLRAALHVHAGTGDVYLFEGHMRIWRESSDSAIFLFPVLAYWMFTSVFFLLFVSALYVGAHLPFLVLLPPGSVVMTSFKKPRPPGSQKLPRTSVFIETKTCASWQRTVSGSDWTKVWNERSRRWSRAAGTPGLGA